VSPALFMHELPQPGATITPSRPEFGGLGCTAAGCAARLGLRGRESAARAGVPARAAAISSAATDGELWSSRLDPGDGLSQRGQTQARSKSSGG
jgi:hypothetical protein